MNCSEPSIGCAWIGGTDLLVGVAHDECGVLVLCKSLVQEVARHFLAHGSEADEADRLGPGMLGDARAEAERGEHVEQRYQLARMLRKGVRGADRGED